ncbi:hypothetical protein UCRPC4_g02363 [Phaeomoniella chlamydospora]|uniref:Uncharacterized protein n=1 Tax=Phaeomoniella chlamydospora TaxID=158046 RepID=A0A0G2EP97_PHACM|nr:hypothetical protein UCRPC4_g02363 [Phaeomoniella chlamydospora]
MMHRGARPEGLDLSTARGARSPSISSDRPSLSGVSLLSPPVNVNPEPLYIAAAAASHLVSSELDADGATVTPAALGLLNSFLDQILFSILSRARSTQLNALRPAVLEVLKNRLGQEAVTGADDELKEYLGDGEDEELAAFHGGQEPKGDFDLELAWKLARLRCMVYTRLGDLEEDDEDEYIEKENLDDGGRAARRYSHPSSVTPAAAIFLTSILEYLGEQGLYYAGQAAQRRLVTSKQDQGEFTALPGIPDKPVVDEVDMFSVGRDSPLSRLWRTWRRNIKSPRGSISRAISRESLIRRTVSSRDPSRHGSISTPADEGGRPHPSVEEVLEEADPSQVPLPMSERDVDEIEVPGLASVIGEEDVEEPHETGLQIAARPKSMFIIPPAVTPPTPSSPNESGTASQRTQSARPTFTHSRSRSLPTPVHSPYTTLGFDQDDESNFVTPMESADPMDSDEHLRTPTQETVTGPGVSRLENVPDHGQSEGLAPAPGPAPEADQASSRRDSGIGESAGAPGHSMLGDFLDIDDGHESREEIVDTTAHPGEGRSFEEPAAHDRSFATTNARSNGVAAVDYGAVDAEDHASSSEESLPATTANQANISSSNNKMPTRTSSMQNATSRSQNLQEPTQTTKVQIISPLRSISKDNSSSRLAPVRELSEEARDIPAAADPTSKSARNQITIPKSQSASTTDRPVVHRVPSSSSAPAINGTRSQRSDSASERRPGTGSSQKSTKPQAVYTALDGSRSQAATGEGKKSLEELIRGDGTLHYTLTSNSMRNMDPPEAPRPLKKTGTSDLAEFLRNTAPPGDNAPRSLMGRSAVSARSSGLHANPLESMPPIPLESNRNRSGSKGSETKTVSSSKSRLRNAQPRAATVPQDTTRDLADFAKSTGPDNPSQLPSSIRGSSGKTSFESAQVSNPRSRPGSQQTVTRQGSVRSGPRLQARDATVTHDKSSELIDFIREGPPQDPRENTHRVPRTVAQSRTTVVDSDDLNGTTNSQTGDQHGRSSAASTQNSSHAGRSVPSSINSRTALIDNTNRAVNIRSSNINDSLGFDDDMDDIKPKRKQRRVRDPYAIDSDDDEDLFEDEPKPKVKPKTEESLMDFLRNTSPPPETKFQPQPLMLSDTQKSQAIKSINMKKYSSTPTLRERLLRSTSGVNLSTNRTPPVPQQQEQSPPARKTPPVSAYNKYTTTSSRPPQTSQSSRSAQYSSSTTTSSSPRTNVAGGPTSLQQSSTGLRPSRSGVGATADLADFLRNSGPPEPFKPPRSQSPDEEERNGFSKFFRRSRKIGV